MKNLRISTSVFSALKKLTQKSAYKVQKISIKVPKNLRQTPKIRIKVFFFLLNVYCFPSLMLFFLSLIVLFVVVLFLFDYTINLRKRCEESSHLEHFSHFWGRRGLIDPCWGLSLRVSSLLTLTCASALFSELNLDQKKRSNIKRLTVVGKLPRQKKPLMWND